MASPESPAVPPDLLKTVQKRAEFRQRLLAYDAALHALKTRHGLPDDVVPLLDTLSQDGNGWRMDFMTPSDRAKTNLPVNPEAFNRLRRFLQEAGKGQQPSSRTSGSGSSDHHSRGVGAFLGFYSTMAGINGFGRHMKEALPDSATDTQRAIFTGRQVVFYLSLTLQGMEMSDLSRQGFKLVFSRKPGALGIVGKNSKLGSQLVKLRKIGALGKTAKLATKLGKKASRFVPVAGFFAQGASLTMTAIEYESEDDPAIKALLEKQLIFEAVDMGVSLVSDLTGPYGLVLDGIMLVAGDIFDLALQTETKEIIFDKTLAASKKAAKTFDRLDAQLLNPSQLIVGRQLNLLAEKSSGKLLPLGYKTISLSNDTLTHDNGTLIPDDLHQWPKRGVGNL